MTTILAIDPGTTQSGMCVADYNGARTSFGLARIIPNRELMMHLRNGLLGADYLAIEQVASYGMPVGETTFTTVEWSGRFIEAWTNLRQDETDDRVLRIPRIEIKSHLCHSARATDANIRQALIDRLGPPGTKKNPGPTYGIKSHLWAALAVAVVAWDRVNGETK